MEPVIQQNVPLAPYTTLKVGGVADYFVVVQTKEELRCAWRFAAQTPTRTLILGGGSNVLIADGQLHRLVIKNELTGIHYRPSVDGVTFATASAGENWDAFVESTTTRGLSGLENLSGIPGTVGAAPVQNINAYGASVSDVMESVEIYDAASDSFRTLSVTECQFGYRDSIFKQPAGAAYVVVAVTFKLFTVKKVNVSYRSASQSVERYLISQNISAPTVVDVRNAVLHVRNSIGMLLGQFNSAGSFFKNTIVGTEQFEIIEKIVAKDFAEIGVRLAPWHWPQEEGKEKIATAFLLECTPYNKNTFGIKRFKDVVGLSPLHSLSVVTYVGATASDVIEFVDEIKTAARNIFGVTLETEVDYFC